MFETVPVSDMWIITVSDASIIGDMTNNVTFNRDMMKSVIVNVDMSIFFLKRVLYDFLKNWKFLFFCYNFF